MPARPPTPPPHPEPLHPPAPSAPRWPTTPGGLASPRDWAAVETLVADVLASLGELSASGEPTPGEGLVLAYLPFTDLGRDRDHPDDLTAAGAQDCSWELGLRRGGPTTTHVGVGAHPLDAADDVIGLILTSASTSGAAAAQLLAADTTSQADHHSRRSGSGQTAPHGGPWTVTAGAGRQLAAAWRGWSGDLLALARATAAGPASNCEPSPAGFDLHTRWQASDTSTHTGSSPATGTGTGATATATGWAWSLSRPEMLDDAGNAVGQTCWAGRTPGEVLRRALAAAPYWYQPQSAWPEHLR